ncbi:MAG: nucleotidyltransferase family protein [Magnetococcales bacterium]|nr:nucleotidyltransferase family protein [Magnetococcales bacterium]
MTTALLTAWNRPETFGKMPIGEQDLILRQLRMLGLLAGFGTRLEQTDLLSGQPARIQEIITGARVIATDQERGLRWEVNRIQRAFFGTGLPVILLKGAAYHLLNLPMAKGRISADVDLLLPEKDLPLAERCLRAHGWLATLPDPYDQHYYREWMHELPPLRHQNRFTELDLHHAILPRTGRLTPDSSRLLEQIQPVPGHPGVWTLCPEDLLLHAVVHLFHDGDFQRMGLRDLLDLDALFRHFDRQEQDFPERLMARAGALNLKRPLRHALRSMERLCHTPIPDWMLYLACRDRVGRMILDPLVYRALLPRHPDQKGRAWFRSWAGWCLYVRSHWLRMPLKLLIPHLWRKWLRRSGPGGMMANF